MIDLIIPTMRRCLKPQNLLVSIELNYARLFLLPTQGIKAVKELTRLEDEIVRFRLDQVMSVRDSIRAAFRSRFQSAFEPDFGPNK